MIDRRVHAEFPGYQIVRYDKAGKWYLEQPGRRRQLTLKEAVLEAGYVAYCGGVVHIGTPGGAAFDRAYQKLNS